MNGDMLPYFRLYAAELLADENTAAFNVAELGAWLRLVCSCWVNGSIPDDPKRLAGLMHTSEEAGAELWLSISDRFAPHPTQEGRLVSRRLERERTEATEARDARVRGGLESARVRRERTGSAQPEREVSRKVSSKSARTHPASQPASPASPPLTSPASQPVAREKANGFVPPAAVPPARGGRLAGWKERLSEALQTKVCVGGNESEVLAFFQSQLDLVGEDTLLTDCLDCARRSKTGTPSSLAWFVPWLERLPVPSAPHGIAP